MGKHIPSISVGVQVNIPDEASLQMPVLVENLNCQVQNLQKKLDTVQTELEFLQSQYEAKDEALRWLSDENDRLSSHLKKEQHVSINSKEARNIKKFELPSNEQCYQYINDYDEILGTTMALPSKVPETLPQLSNQCARLYYALADYQKLINEHQEETDNLKSVIYSQYKTIDDLWVKFLEVKNAKDHIQIQFAEKEDNFMRTIADAREKMGDIQQELDQLVNTDENLHERINDTLLLQIARENIKLIHDNLILQMETYLLKNTIFDLKQKIQTCCMLVTTGDNMSNNTSGISQASGSNLKSSYCQCKTNVGSDKHVGCEFREFGKSHSDPLLHSHSTHSAV